MHQELWEQDIDWENPPDGLQYIGDLDDVIENLNSSIKGQRPLDTFLWASRTIHAGINYSNRTRNGWRLKRKLLKGVQQLLKEPEPLGIRLTREELKMPAMDCQGPYGHVTWQCTHPGRIKQLAEKVKEHYQPDIIIGAAYGAVRPGLLLAELLDTELEFIRYSRRRLEDTGAVFGPGEERALRTYIKGKKVLLFEEDVATGITLNTLEQYLTPLTKELRTAAIRVNWDSRYTPDFYTEEIW